jgi:hypothetical protein
MWHSTPECFFWPKYNFDEKENPTIGNRCATWRAIEAQKDRRSDEGKMKPK